MTLLEDNEPKTDEELVALSLENEDNFLYLMRRYEDKLLRYIKRITNVSDDDAQDILQDTFVKTYRNLNEFDKNLKFSSWIYRIAHNQVISNYRRMKARPEGNYFELDDNGINRLVAEIDIEKDINKKMDKEKIIAVLEKMDEKYRDVLVLKFLEEKDYNEISDILKKPLGTVATLISRAKKKFRETASKAGIGF
jgi:RNA polymerase sigma-70 factor, ECF subfamily